MPARQVTVPCCIAGGGPAGMLLGLLLARAGVGVLVLEKHADFLRDFRGDTIHPSTLEIVAELGLLEQFLKLPHQEIPVLRVRVGDVLIPFADFTHVPTRCRFLAIMPQWDFLNFLAEQAARSPAFALEMNAEATGLIEESGRIVGLRATTATGPLEVRADLVVGADGRGSTVRAAAGLAVEELGAPMDVLWFRLSRVRTDPSETTGRFDAGRIFVAINRGEHWQLGYVIPKGTIENIRREGIGRFREEIGMLMPFARDRLSEIRGWDDVKLLTVRVDRLRRWYRPGLLCIGDAAHAMSPVGGVGINLAIQDAVAAANQLATPLRDGRLSEEDLRRVQRRREMPTRVIQRLQIVAQSRVISPVLRRPRGTLRPPLALRLFQRHPVLRRLPARLIGVGIRPEHVHLPPAPAPSRSA